VSERLSQQQPTHSHKSNYNYTPLIAKLIETCYQIKVIKLRDLAKYLGISISYTYHLIKKLYKDLFFKIWALPHYERVGLRHLRCFLQVDSAAYRQTLLELLPQHDFVIYVFQYYGSLGKGVYCEFLVPDGKGDELASFLETLQNYGIIDSHAIRPIISLKNIVMGFKWYDFSTNSWRFDWQALLKEILSSINSHECPQFYELESQALSTKFDFYDLFILHHLEQEVFTPLAPLALKLRTSPQNLSYHFRNHVLGNELIRTTRPWWYPFLFEESSYYVLEIKFESHKALNCFLKSLHRKPIAYSCTCYEQATYPSVILSGVLPYDELFSFTNLLDLLRDYGIVKNYDYYILDLYGSKGKALPYHCYDEVLGWRFELEPCLEGILKATRKVQERRAKLASAADSKIEPV